MTLKPNRIILMSNWFDWSGVEMFTSLKIPTYKRLLELSDGELIKRVNEALDQLRQAEEQGETSTEQIKIRKIYMLYKNELTKRNYRRTH